MLRQTRRLSAKRPRKPKIFGENGDGNPTVGNFSKRNSSRPVIANESISFSETKSITSCPRDRSTSATARPGNKWPPVPPHAITVFMKWALYDSYDLHPWRRARPDDRAFLFRRIEHTLPVNVQQKPDPKQTCCQVRPAIADERQRQPFVRQQRRRHTDVHCGL